MSVCFLSKICCLLCRTAHGLNIKPARSHIHICIHIFAPHILMEICISNQNTYIRKTCVCVCISAILMVWLIDFIFILSHLITRNYVNLPRYWMQVVRYPFRWTHWPANGPVCMPAKVVLPHRSAVNRQRVRVHGTILADKMMRTKFKYQKCK